MKIMYECEECKKYYNSEKLAVKCFNSHERNPRKIYVCDYCDSSFLREEICHRHEEACDKRKQEKKQKQKIETPWKEIETAPKDREILLFYPDYLFITHVNKYSEIIIGKWDNIISNFKVKLSFYGYDYQSDIIPFNIVKPTHWMEIPKFPIK